jgi:hypothetical protein
MKENIDLMSYVESNIPGPDDMDFKTRGRVGAQRIAEKMNKGRKGESNEATGMDSHGVAPCPTAPTEENTASMLATLASLRGLDVCLGGKGIAFSQHEGNRRFQQLLNSYSQPFSEAITDGEKSDVRNKIMDKLEKCGYRFVRIEGTGNLTVLSYATVRRKVRRTYHCSSSQAQDEFNNPFTVSFSACFVESAKKRKQLKLLASRI